MKKLLLPMLITASAFAWDCTNETKDVKLSTSPAEFCRNYATYKTVRVYDQVSIKRGSRLSYDEDFNNAIINAIKTETNQCYETCMMAHSM